MKRSDFPKWIESPYFLAPLVAALFAIFMLPAISDRAAMYAGGLTAAVAAVIAVIVGGAIQSGNDRSREARAHHFELRTLATELQVLLTFVAIDIGKITADMVREEAAKRPKPYSIGVQPTPTNTTYPHWCERVNSALRELPERIPTNVGKLDRRSAEYLIEYIRVAEQTKGYFKRLSQPPLGFGAVAPSPLSADQLAEIRKALVPVSAVINDASNSVTAYIASLAN